MAALSPALKAIIAMIVGIILAALAIFAGTAALTPAAKQSDSPLIVYGES